MKKLLGVVVAFLVCYSCKSPVSSNAGCSCDPSVIIRLEAGIDGYTDRISYYPNDTVRVHVSSSTEEFNIQLIEQSLESKSLFDLTSVNGIVQEYNQCSFKEGCDWDITESIVIPSDASSSYQTILLSNEHGQFHIPLIIKSRKKSNILCIASTNTWHAYNSWGGANFYTCNIADTTMEQPQFSGLISMQRPLKVVADLTYQGHLFDAELAVIHWLEKEEYEFDVISDLDLHQHPDILMGYDMVILNTHSEYWSESALDGLYAYMQDRGNLCYLGANGMHWKVTMNGTTMECQKDGANHISDGSKGGLWRKQGKEEEKVIGTTYRRAGFNTYMPYMVVDEKHWLFKNTGLKNGDLFGKSLNRGYASGHETDRPTRHSPENMQIIARGVNQEAFDQIGKPDADRDGGAYMVYFDHQGGGSVFASSSITSGASLLCDSTMSTVLSDLIGKMTGIDRSARE